MPTSNRGVGKWNFHTEHVQPDFKSGQFGSAESTLVAAGPPRLSQAAGGGGATGTVFPIGLLENVAVSQSKQLQRIFEIGSSRSYFIPGRVIGSVSLGRVFYYGPSLLRCIYAYFPNPKGEAGNGSTVDTGTFNQRLNPSASLISINSITSEGSHKVEMSPGDDYFWINLASDLFNQATGLGLFFKDSHQNLIGAMYLEDCYVQGHQMTISSGSVLIMEGATMQFDRAQSIRATTAT